VYIQQKYTYINSTNLQKYNSTFVKIQNTTKNMIGSGRSISTILLSKVVHYKFTGKNTHLKICHLV